MGKSVYSVVLDDEVVKYADKAAAKTGESRSQFINRVIAKEVGFSTSRQKLDEVIDALGAAIATHEKIRMVRRQQSVVDFLSALNYKYSPRVTYSVELDPENARQGSKSLCAPLRPRFRAYATNFLTRSPRSKKARKAKIFSSSRTESSCEI